MTDFDLDRLGDVWRQQPDPKEIEALKRSAATVSRRARWQQVMDVTAAVGVAGIVLFLVTINPRLDTLLAGGAAILLLLANHVRQRRQRQLELKSLTGTAEEMLDQSIERTQRTLRYNLLTLILFVPGIILGNVLATTAGSSVDRFLGWIRGDPTLRFAWFGFCFILFVAVIAGLVRATGRYRRELGRLKAMRETYRTERETSGD